MFSFTQPDGSSRTVAGYHYAAPPGDVQRYAARLSHVPQKVDLRRFMTPIENQGQTSSCVANAMAGAYEYLVKRHLGSDGYDVSRLFIYYNARYIGNPNGPIEDQGSFIKDAVTGLHSYGACSEATWAFIEDNVNVCPPTEAYNEASRFLIEQYHVVETRLEDWKTALAEGHPIVFACKTFTSFGQNRRGLVAMPTQNEAIATEHGSHAMLCVGYSDPDQVFIVRNSWGPGWGDKGYCYVPYRYLMNPQYNLNDSWIIQRIDMLPPDEDTWAEDEETVLEDVSGLLADMDEDTYGRLLDRMGSVPLEVRLSLLFLRAAGADGQIAEEEFEDAAEYVRPVLEQLGSLQSAETVLRNTQASFSGNEDLVWETVGIFGEVFPQEVLASITSQLQDIVGSDNVVSASEQDFVDAVVERWQIAPAEEDDEDEEGGEDGEEGDEDEEGDEEGDDDEEEGEEEDEEDEYAREEDVEQDY